jgi:hypothetical protein
MSSLQLKEDLDELNKLAAASVRPRVQRLLQDEAAKVKQELQVEELRQQARKELQVTNGSGGGAYDVQIKNYGKYYYYTYKRSY